MQQPGKDFRIGASASEKAHPGNCRKHPPRKKPRRNTAGSFRQRENRVGTLPSASGKQKKRFGSLAGRFGKLPDVPARCRKNF